MALTSRSYLERFIEYLDDQSTVGRDVKFNPRESYDIARELQRELDLHNATIRAMQSQQINAKLAPSHTLKIIKKWGCWKPSRHAPECECKGMTPQIDDLE